VKEICNRRASPDIYSVTERVSGFIVIAILMTMRGDMEEEI
jgi:hypothetical protein